MDKFDTKKIQNYIKKYLNDSENFLIEKNISKIIELIKYANYTYFNTNSPILTDKQYDNIIDFLNENKDFENVSKLLSEVGHVPTSGKKKKLDYKLMSMNKLKEEKDIKNWIKKFSGPYFLSHKLDGVSIMIKVDKKNSKIKMYTRGDGTTGTDVSHLVPYIKNIQNLNKLLINDSIKNNIVIRGELLISKKKFGKIDDQFSNARNFVSGIVNSKNSIIEKKNYLDLIDFVAYELIFPELKFSEQMIFLKKLGIDIVVYDKVVDLSIENLTKLLVESKNNSIYEIDGIIIINDEKYPRTDKNPKHAFAFKSDSISEIKEVKVIDIEWKVSKDYNIKPTIIIEDTQIDGVTVKRITGNNAKFIVDNMIGPGAILHIIRSGGVIPKVVKVIKPAKKLKMPVIEYKWNKTNVDIVYNKDSKPSKNNTTQSNHNVEKEVLIKNLTFFIKKIGIKNLDTKIIEKLVDSGINSIPKILNVSIDQLLSVENFKEKMAKKIYDNIKEATKEIDLVLLMAASNKFGSGMGERKINAIIKEYPNIIFSKDDNKKKIEQIININGFEETSAKKFVNNIKNFIDFYNEIKSLGIKINLPGKNKVKEENNKKGLFNNMNIVFSGIRDKKLEKYIIDNGGNILSKVSKNTNILIVKDIDSTSSNVTKAKELNSENNNIEIIQYEKFINKFLSKSKILNT